MATKKKVIQTSQITLSDNAWEISNILLKAYIRWKKRFLSYFLAGLLIGCTWIGLNVAILLIESIASIIGAVFFKSTVVLIITVTLGTFISLAVTVYLFFLFTLTGIRLLLETNLGVREAIKTSKQLVWKYIWVIGISLFFLAGLFPLGIISFFIITLLWSFWSSFTTFIYLEQKQKGLRNLWVSRTMYNQKFSLLFWRSLIPLGTGFLISIPHWIAASYIGQQSIAYTIIYVSTYVLNFLYTSYFICYNYELYKKLEIPITVKPPKVWIWLSIAGWIVNIFLIIMFSFLVIQILPVVRHYSPKFSIRNKSAVQHDANIIYYQALTGKQLQTPDRIFTLESVKANFHPSQYDDLLNSEEFIVSHVSIENISQQNIAYNTYDFFIQTANGDLIGPSFTFHIQDHDLLGSGNLARGAKKSGVIVYKLQKSEAPFTLLYKPHVADPVKTYTIEAKL